MKQLLLIILSATCCFITSAQIMVTSTTFPVVGDKLRYIQAANPIVAISLFTPPGGNQNWNLSTLKAGTLFETAYRAASEGANFASFPGANMLVIGATGEFYYKTSATKFELLGQAAQTVAGVPLKAIYKNSPPIAVRHSPLNFFDIYQQSSSNLLAWAYNDIPNGTLNFPARPDSIRFRISNSIIEVVDGWGTLTLPGSLPQSQYPVLRLKKTTYHEQRMDAKIPPLGWLDVTDLVIRGGTSWSNLFGVDTTVTHHYFNNVSKEEIATLTFNNEQNAVLSVVYKNTAASTPIINVDAFNTATIQLFPNPAMESVTIRTTTPIENSLRFAIHNTLGQLIKTGTIAVDALSNGFSLDCANMPNGVYLLRFDVKTVQGVERLVINR